MSYIHLDLLFRLIAAHVVSDFIFQSDKWIEDRQDRKIRSEYLYLHSLITLGLTFIAMGSWCPIWIPLLITFSHLGLDLLKSYIKVNEKVWYRKEISLFALDQIIHIVIIVSCWLIYTRQFVVLYNNFILQYFNSKICLLITGYIIVTIPTSILITKLTAKWGAIVNNNEKEDGLKDAGKWIGIIERILVLSFTLAGKYEAIGFILAAKSVFRIGDLKEPKHRNMTEYILIGTLLSFSISIILGLLINKFIKTL